MSTATRRRFNAAISGLTEAAQAGVARIAAAVARYAPVVVGRLDDADAEPRERTNQLDTRASGSDPWKCSTTAVSPAALRRANLRNRSGHTRQHRRILVDPLPWLTLVRVSPASSNDATGPNTASTRPSSNAVS